MQCRICGCDVTPGAAVACGRCGVPFHRDCWEFNGGCGIFGCCGGSAAPWRPPAEGALLSIDETTRPPLRLAPLVESLLRRLPAWGRAHVPPTLLGGLGGGLVTAFCAWTSPCPFEFQGLVFFAVIGACVGLVASFVADAQRRHPAAVAFCSLGATGAALACGHWAPLGPGDGPWATYAIIGTFLAASVLASTSLVELASKPLRIPWEGGRVAGFIGRGVATTVVFCGLMALLNWYMGNPSSDFWSTAPLALLGLGAVLPSVELSKSALLHRLKEEARRDGEGR